MTVLRFGGLFVVFSGVVVFGMFFIGGNARAINGQIPASAWKGAGPKKGMQIIALGTLMLLGAFLIGYWMPNGL